MNDDGLGLIWRKAMYGLTVTEHQGQRILSTDQLAAIYETEGRRITENFNRNSEHFTAGVHYFLIEGDELKAFKSQYAGSVSPFASQLYLWTERGANRHCKILDTDKAWQQFDMLEETYFKVKAALPAMSQAEIIAAVAQIAADQERALRQLEATTAQQGQQIVAIKEAIITKDEDWRRGINDRLNAIAKARGGAYQDVRTESYDLLESRAACLLATRVKHLQSRLANAGGTKSQIAAVNKLDVVEADVRLKEIYSSIVRELCIKYIV